MLGTRQPAHPLHCGAGRLLFGAGTEQGLSESWVREGTSPPSIWEVPQTRDSWLSVWSLPGGGWWCSELGPPALSPCEQALALLPGAVLAGVGDTLSAG